MNYQKISHNDVSNGSGVGMVLWVSGCTQHCFGCHNPETWDFNSGIPYTPEIETEIINSLKPDYISRLTLSGGHPLEAENIKTVFDLCKKVKSIYPNKKIWLYTGYTWENINGLPILKYVDVLVDGKFVQDLRDITLKWKGSSNQRVIDVQKSLEKGKIILWEN